MGWPARVVASGRRVAADRAYRHARLQAVRRQTPQPAAWWGLCGVLSTHQLHHGTLRPQADLWAELLPFLRIADEALAVRVLEEYLVYLDDPASADKQWLGLALQGALASVDAYDPDVAELLEEPASVYDARWMALLAYDTLVRLRRAVRLYEGRFPYPARPAYWHGAGTAAHAGHLSAVGAPGR